jgi:hypothetical protein
VVENTGDKPIEGQHLVENTGDKAFEGILVEMKGAAGTRTTAK